MAEKMDETSIFLNEKKEDESGNNSLDNPTANQETNETPKMVSQSLVNRLMADSKEKFFEKGYKKALEELQMKNYDNSPENFEIQNKESDKSSENSNDIRQIIAEEYEERDRKRAEEERMRQEESAFHQLSTQLVPKIRDASTKYSDFEEVIGKGPKNILQSIPEVAALANAFDNGGEVLYHLFKDPDKLAKVRTLFQIDQEGESLLAYKEMEKLSKSIKNIENSDVHSPSSSDSFTPLQQSSVDRGSGPQRKKSLNDRIREARLTSKG